jgi:DNA polymerase-1
VPQFPLIRDAVRAFGLKPIEQKGYEADDIIATYARQTVAAGATAIIVSGDKDLMQVVGPGIVMYDPMPGNERHIGPDEVIAKFGVPPEKVVDVQSLCGDSTDNVPGVPGIGIKTAAQLIQEYGDLDTLLANAASIKQPARRERLLQYADQARISRELVRLKDDLDVETPLAETCLSNVDPAPLMAFMRMMEFTTLTKRIATAFGVDMPEMTAPQPAKEEQPAPAPDAAPDETGEARPTESMPARVAAEAKARIRAIPVNHTKYETVTTLARLNALIAEAREIGHVCIDTETTGLDALKAELVGFAMSVRPGTGCYVPLAHRMGDRLNLEGASLSEQIPFAEGMAAIKSLLEDEGVLKIGQNTKYDIMVLRRYDIAMAPVDDTMLLSYVLDAGIGVHGMDELAQRHLGHKCIAYKEVAGTGRQQVTFDCVPIDKATHYAGEDADITLRLWHILKPRLVAEGMSAVYERLERPMIPVLADMECAGIKIHPSMLQRFSQRFGEQLVALEGEIYDLAGEKFNVGSTKQLAEILFGKLGYPGGKKTGGGAWSTGATVLDDLATSEAIDEEARRLPLKLLEWRQLSKLKSTYTDALPTYVNERTGRIHTCYSLASTSTGRLSSVDPNLQNIPIRTQEGRQIRSAFIASEGHKLVSADYSQIELRVLAHIADIKALKNAFAEGLDIHAMTASEMFDVALKDMTSDIRRRAKAINFGIIYGISAFGLSQQLGIPRSEAGDYINRYFERFPGIRAYMNATRDAARRDGYVKTIFGRKIHFPDIMSSNRAMRAFFERAAINAPIQGSAADIIRRAMVRMPGALAEAGLKTRMLLQVHDELVFEAPENEVNAVIGTVCRVMERSPEPAAMLSVPLKVDARAADNWDEAH